MKGEASDIGPCPFNIGDVVEIGGYLRGNLFEVKGRKKLEVDRSRNVKQSIWMVCLTEVDELSLTEVWDEVILGDMKEPGDDEV